MWDGKKSTALKFYDAIDIIEAKSKMQKTIIRHLKDALANVMPHVEVVVESRWSYISNSMQIDQTEKFLWQ
jgi:ribosomal protein S7